MGGGGIENSVGGLAAKVCILPVRQRDAAGPAGGTPALRHARFALQIRGTLTLSDCGTIVITSGVFIVTTSPSMPRWRRGLDDWILTRDVRKERKPGASRTRPAR